MLTLPSGKQIAENYSVTFARKADAKAAWDLGYTDDRTFTARFISATARETFIRRHGDEIEIVFFNDNAEELFG